VAGKAKGVGRRGRGPALAALALALAASALCATARPVRQGSQRPAAAGASALNKPTRYQIKLALDFAARRFEGTQRVTWVNRAERPASTLYFHLYPNLRAEAPREEQRAAPPQESGASAEAEEPRLEVTRAAQAGQPLEVSAEDGGATIRVQLREAVQPGAAAEIEMAFRGAVPEIAADETSLLAHVVQQVGAAMRDAREVRRARDANFVSRGVMLLGSFYPVLAARVGAEWRRRAELTVGDVVFADPADYDVEVEAPADLALYASAAGAGGAGEGAQRARRFAGRNLRGFALVAGHELRSAERAAGGVTVRSVYTAGHEKVGQRVLQVAADAARVYAARFGPPPSELVTVAEAPLVAGLGSAEFAGLAVFAGAFYVDFDSPAVRSLPEIVREQRSSFEESLEFAVAQGVAHQWWGEGVGSDPAREPVLDEGLAHWSALLYVREARGDERARQAEEDQLRGVYQLYRTFGGEDMAADRPAREYRNSLQYAAVVASKGALMFASLRQLLGDESFFRALRSFYAAHSHGVADLSDLRASFASVADVQQRRALNRLFERWLGGRHGDEDIAPPNEQLADSLGLPAERQEAARDRNAFSRLGRFFWRQMTRIR